MTSSKHKSCRVVFVVVAITALIVLAGCNQRSSQELRVGVNAWPGYEALYLAQHRGLFEREGINVKLVDFQSLGDARRAFERGQVDVFASTIVEMLASYNNAGRNAQVIYAIDFSNGSDMLLAHPSISGLEDLKGKRVAAEPASVDVLAVFHALRSVGLNLSDIKLVPLSQGEIPQAYERGEIDAAESYPPASLELQRKGARKIFDSSEMPGVILDVLIAEAKIVSERKADLVALVRAFAAAQEIALSNAQADREFMANREGLSVEEFNQAFSGLKVILPNEQLGYLSANGKIAPILAEAFSSLKHTGHIEKEIDISTTYTAAIVEELNKR